MSRQSEWASIVNKKRVSIDQCFLSNMCKGDAKSLKLLSSLNNAHAAGRIVCPIHLEESIFESAFLSANLRDKIFALQNRLSDGFSFHSLSQQLQYQTKMFVMPTDFSYPSIRQVSLKILPGTDFDVLAKKFKLGKADYVYQLNQIPYPPASYKSGMKGDEIMEFIQAERAGSMYRILEAIKVTGKIETGMPEWELAEDVGVSLLRMGISEKDCDVLLDKVLKKTWSSIPYLWTHTRINAQIELDYLAGLKKASVNDLLDLSRISVALNDATVVLCDTAMAEKIKQSKVQEILDSPNVFSMKQQDEAADFIASA